MTRLVLLMALAGILIPMSGCAIQELKGENKRLKDEIAALEAQLAAKGQGPTKTLTPVRSFTVGLAAAERTFDEQAFFELLKRSLETGAQSRSFRIDRESDPQEINKFRGMLVQQYLAAEEIPIKISNLSYKLQESTHDFRIGGKVVPRSSTHLTRRASAGAVHVSAKQGLAATMRRDLQGNYSIAYEEIGGGQGRIPVPINDVEILDPNEEAQFARQGDLSFNWNLNLAKVVVYKIEGYQGDIGAFLRTMRYPGITSSISQYQTLRDFVYLFGYGNYSTVLVNQLHTPANISTVEVMALTQNAFEQLKSGMGEEEIVAICGRSGGWQPCEFVDFADGQRVWKRPAEVALPFISRQVSDKKMHSFYTKYSAQGASLIGDFEASDVTH